MNRNNVLNILGKILTPLIIIILVAIIIIGFVFAPDTINASLYKTPFIYGLLEGYQTYDAIGGLLMGGVVVISLNLKGYTSFNDKRKIITKAGLIAATGLFSIYAGLIALGAFYNAEFDVEISRTALLSGLSLKTLGGIGTVFLSVLVALACFTTAVTVIVGTADFFKGIFKGSKTVYGITALLSCLIGILVGQFDVHYIIDIAVPALFFIYPVTIVLIFLNVLPERFTRPIVFKWVVFMAILFSLPDFLQSIGISESIRGITQFIPLSKFKMGWVLPAFTTLILMNLLRKRES
jgi:LIVCS family branched-chain amino acid:cation transporter